MTLVQIKKCINLKIKNKKQEVNQKDSPLVFIYTAQKTPPKLGGVFCYFTM